MADKGLVSKSTLQGFADEVRRLTESEQTGTPAEMLTLLQTVETGGGAEMLWGEVTVSNGTTIETGVQLPFHSNYIVFVGHYDITLTFGSNVSWANWTICSEATESGANVLKSLNIQPTSSSNKAGTFTRNNPVIVSNFESGTLTASKAFGTNRNHIWMYVGWDN